MNFACFLPSKQIPQQKGAHKVATAMIWLPWVANEHVVRFEITMDYANAMECFQHFQHLNGIIHA
jgi:hypothetical protein